MTKASFSNKSCPFSDISNTNTAGTPEATGMATRVPESGPPDTVVGGMWRWWGRSWETGGESGWPQRGIQGQPQSTELGRHARSIRDPGPQVMPAVPKENTEFTKLGN